MLPKILIAAPTADVKNYCLEKWLLNLNNLKYPNFQVLLADNTPDGGKNAHYINKIAGELPLIYPVAALSVYDQGNKVPESLIARIRDGHNACRKYAIDNNFIHWLHLETDVMPEANVIEQLLSHKKQVVGALYYRDEGKFRKLMAQRHIFRSATNIMAENFSPSDDACFIDGTLKKVAHIGLGCALIHKSVFSTIEFRYKEGIDTSPDSYFAEDCFKNKIPIYADASLICQHDNTPWGIFGEDYK